MSNVVCENCGSVITSNDKFCRVCGISLVNGEQISSKTSSVQQQTFFCPKCNLENSINNLFCDDCGDDFSKYNIKTSFSETAKSHSGATKDVLFSGLYRKGRSSSNIFLTLLMIFSGLIFLILSIVTALAFNVWMSGMAGLVPAFFALIFGVIWLTTTIIWILFGRRKKSR